MLQATIGLCLLLSPAAAQDEILFPGTGPHTRKVTTSSAKAQQFFDQGLNFMYAFNHGEAKRSFRAATRHDPSCAMAWWGLAMANGPHVNNMAVAPEEEKEAYDALRTAKTHMAGNPAVDQALIVAATARFADPQPADRTPLNRAFAGEMRKVWARFGNDSDVGALFAESMLDLRPWDYWTPVGAALPGTLEAVAALEKVIRLNPKHPLGLHLYIHAVEASLTPERARVAADTLRNLQPGLGHNVHMPTHIDVRLGEWQKAIDSNYKAIVADRNYRAQRPDQFIYRIYMAHNNHMLAFAAMMNGQSELAIEMLDDMVMVMPDDFKVAAAPFIDGFIAMPMEARKRFGKWDEVLAMPAPAEQFPLARAMRHAARGVSWAAKGESSKARQEQFLFYRAKDKIPEGQTFGQNNARKLAVVAMHVLNGEILVSEGKVDRAIAELSRGVSVEDTLRFSEPPDWIQPTRHTLGALLIKVGRYSEAERVYRADLKKLPNNGWALYGLAECQEARGANADSRRTRATFKEVWAKADIEISSSCLCIPGR